MGPATSWRHNSRRTISSERFEPKSAEHNTGWWKQRRICSSIGLVDSKEFGVVFGVDVPIVSKTALMGIWWVRDDKGNWVRLHEVTSDKERTLLYDNILRFGRAVLCIF